MWLCEEQSQSESERARREIVMFSARPSLQNGGKARADDRSVSETVHGLPWSLLSAPCPRSAAQADADIADGCRHLVLINESHLTDQ